MLLNRFEKHNTESKSATIATILFRAKLTLERLYRLVQAKLLKNANGSVRAWRRAWLGNKSKVSRIQGELKEHRANWAAIACADNLWVLKTVICLLTC